ncbi:MAG TPA: MarR family transcriptional regulator [Allosphingosinicella sp.]|nr:MarR family transcriptional regulator [Allosphingosinicella sp.]
MGLEEVGPTLELLSLDACRLAARLVEAAEAERLRRMTDHGRIALTARFVQSLIAARRLRSDRLGPALAPEPGWSVLLALYAAHLEDGPPLTLAALTQAAAAPGSTVHGRLAALEAQGLVARTPDPARGRGTIVRLTDEAAARIHDYLREAREI